MASGDESLRELTHAVLMHGPISRADLAGRLGLSAPSLTRLSRPLVERGVFVELGEHASGSVGRPSRPLDIRRDATSVVGIKLTGDAAHGVLTDLRADVLDRVDRPLASHSIDDVVEVLAEVIAALSARSAPRVGGVGVTIGGNTVDGRVVTRAPFLGWRDVPLADLLERRAGLPVVVENDVVGLTEAEHWFGLGRGRTDFSVVTIGAGVGYGLVVHDRVVSTRDTGLGLGGHIPLAADGPVCMAGHRGCATAMLAIPYIEAGAESATGRRIAYADLLELARRGDAAVTPIIDAAADALGRLCALSANLTMQSTIVLSGEGMGLWAVAGDRVLRALRDGRDPDASPVEVLVDDADFGSWSRGAAALAAHRAVTRAATAP